MSIPAANRLVTGSDNFPPPKTAIELAAEAVADLAAWANDNPTVSNAEQAKAAELQVKRGTEALRVLEAERDGKVSPLNEKVKLINGAYKAAKAPLDIAVETIDGPRKAWLRAEEDRRIKAAEAARAAKAEAERIAREAEARERAAIEDAAAGVAEANVVDMTVHADQSFNDFERASRFAARAERDSKVKGLRTTEVLEVKNIAAASAAMADDLDLIEAIKTAARRYRKTWGDLPPGVISHQERV
jgi:hypothetical protein